VTNRLKAATCVWATATLGALVSTTAAAGQTSWARPNPAKVRHVPAAVRSVVRKLDPDTMLARPQSASVLRKKARRNAPVFRTFESTFSGFGYCSKDLLQPDEGEFWAWPVVDSGHDMVLTLPVFVDSTTVDFSAPNTTPAPWVVIQYGGEFYYLDLDTSEIDGPYGYMDAWTVNFWQTPENLYRRLVNETWFSDAGTFSGPYAYNPPLFGTFAFGSYCLN